VFCLWSVPSEFMALFMVCNLWIVPGFIFESRTYFFNIHFTCYYTWARSVPQVYIIKSYCVYVAQ
jgi:hypothetical protein